VWQGGIDVRLGLEADYLPGLEGFLEEQLASADFHHVLGSVHPQLTEYKERYFHGDIVAFQRQYFEHLALAAESGFFDTLAHPDLVKNVYPDDWKPERVRACVVRSLDRIAATGVAMELNTSGMFKAITEMNPGLTMLAAMYEREIPVVIGADAHVPERVGDGYAAAFDMLESVGYSNISIFLSRRRTEIPIESARATLRATVSRA
jgi:histidinol-phosphatase (PHP family)